MKESAKYDYFNNNLVETELMPSDVRECMKDTKCDSCKGKIKKKSIYFRRSFGRMWTWKACSVRCAEELINESAMWVY